MRKQDFSNMPNENLASDIVLRLLARDDTDFYVNRTDRNIGWITREEQELIKNSTVGIAGCGGMGGLVAVTLLRLGVGTIKIADNEAFDVSNLNRQFAATMATIGESKAIETARMLRAIADDTIIEVYPQGITEETVHSFVDGCDIICDEIEFWATGARILLHQAMRQRKSMILCAPTVGHRVYVFKFTHNSLTMETVLSMSYEEALMLQNKISSGTANEEEVKKVMDAMLHFAAPEIPEYSLDTAIYSTRQQLRDRLFKETRASIIATNPPMASGFLCNQVIFHLLEKSPIQRNYVLCPAMPAYVMFDAGHMKATVLKFAKPW
jgi:molybdopterin/thiamine biosynthesis adenylyltransferase